jgi:hypothetical protein
VEATAAQLGPWLTIAALGAYHGLNPAMGWLFAVALGLHRGSQRVVLASLGPIALGHAGAVAAVAVAVAAFGVLIDPTLMRKAAGVTLLGWAGWHTLYGHRRRVRIGMQTGLAGLALWSFLMAGAHGAGLMLVPAVLPLCSAAAADGSLGGPLTVAAGAVAVHTAAMLAVIAAVSIVVFRWTGLGFLRRGWINLDLLWSLALAVCGAVLIAA